MTPKPGNWKRVVPGYYQHASGVTVFRVTERVLIESTTPQGVVYENTQRTHWRVKGSDNKFITAVHFDTAHDAMRFVDIQPTNDPKGNT